MRAETVHQVILVGIIIGIGLSVYAGLETIDAAASAACSFTGTFSCAAVLQSGLTTLLGVPDWIVGLGGFVAMLAVDLPLLRTWRRTWLRALLALSTVGIAVSAYLASIEVFQIGALCPVCVSSYVANGVVLAGAVTLYRKGRAEGAPARGTTGERATRESPSS